MPRVLVTGDDVAEGKPHPQGYISAARLLGVPPAQYVVLEDAAPGIRAARSAEVGSVAGVGGPRFGEDRPGIAVTDLRALRWTGDGLKAG
jgi:sugar-phosphatase